MGDQADPKGAYYWIDKFCQNNPTATIYAAAEQFAVARLKKINSQ